MSLDDARKVADAILYEGYVLYPYRASARKNQLRWQFGVLVPRRVGEAESAVETWASQTECLLDPGPGASLRLLARFLQAQARIVEEVVPAGDGEPGRFRPVESLELDGEVSVSWDEGVEHEVDTEVTVDELVGGGERVIPVEVPGSEETTPLVGADGRLAGRVVRRREPVTGRLLVSAELLPGPYGVVRLRVRFENVTDWHVPGASRDEVCRRSLLSAHTLLAIRPGRFVSLLDPPEWAGPATRALANLHTWPVLIGEGRDDVVLSSPIILYDHPQIAPESPGELYDSTEIDEILTLRTLVLTDEEKRQARATDARAAAVIERVDSMPPEIMERLHGAIRSMRSVGQPVVDEAGAQAFIADPETPWWDPAADRSVNPDTDSVVVAGVEVAKGSRVVLAPGTRRSDAQDMFLAGKLATVEAVLADVDEGRYLAVTLDDDPASELHQWYGRFLYFRPDEVVPLEAAS